MSRLLTGKEVAAKLREETITLVKALAEQSITPCLGVIRIGEQADDVYYENSLKKSCANTGIDCLVNALPENASQQDAEQAVAAASKNPHITGILLFSPLPKHFDEDKIRSVIAKEKDVDCMTLASAADVYSDSKEGFAPCTAAAVMEILKYYEIPIAGKTAAVVGRSMVVGKPLAMLLLKENATVTICHSRTPDTPSITKRADIVVAAIGRARLLGAEYFSENQTIIDVGINADPDREGAICGDIDFAAVETTAGYITPVPGGVGSVTSAILCRNTALAAKNINAKKN